MAMREINSAKRSLLMAGLICFLTVAGLNAPAVAASPEIEYAFPDQSVWTARVDVNSNPENPLLGLATQLFDKAGIPWHSKRYPAARMFNYLNDGTAQFSMLVKSQQLADCCLTSKAPVASTELRVYRLADRAPIRTREDLVGKKIITIRGYSYGGLLPFLNDPGNGITVNSTMKHDAAFAMLEAGRADYLLDYTGPSLEMLAQHPIAAARYDVLGRLDVHLVLVRTYPNAEAVMARLEAIMETLDKDQILGLRNR
jgi:ABC-type amino acid transport substrate-binding protein